MPKAHYTERDLHKLHALKHHLGGLYTWRQQAKRGKNPKICGAHAPRLHPSWPQAAPEAHAQPLFPLSITDGEGEEGQERDGVSLQRPVLALPRCTLSFHGRSS